MGSKENIAELGKATRVKKGSNGLPGAGRKPSYLKKYIKDDGIGVDDIRRLLGHIVNIRNLDKLTALLKDDRTPMAIRVFSKSIIAEFKQNKNDTLKWLINYAYGMPKQSLEADVKASAADIPPEERNAAMRDAMRDMAKKDPEFIRGLLEDKA